MAKLTPEQLASRLKLDYKIASSMQGKITTIEAYPDPTSLKRRSRAILDAQAASQATHYLIDYRIKSLIDAGTFHDSFTVAVDLQAGGNYPFSEPVCYVISTPVPWSPHFLAGAPICLGEMWKDMRGHGTVGHLIIHIAKLLNFDEPERSPGYGGWRPEAVRYWKDVLKSQPITADLAYPILPADLTHGLVEPPRSCFTPLGGSETGTAGGVTIGDQRQRNGGEDGDDSAAGALLFRPRFT